MAGHAARVCVVNLGCKVNRVESDWMEAAFTAAGAALVAEGEADIVAVNTCAVTGEAEAKTRKAVRHAANLPQRPLVAVTGCVANLFPAELEALGANVRVFPNKATLAAEALAAWVAPGTRETGEPDAGESIGTPNPAPSAADFPGAAPQPAPPRDEHADAPTSSGRVPQPPHRGGEDCPRPGEVGAPVSPHGAFRSRRGVKVQDGCDNRCTYCIVWKARGASRSVPLADIERQIRQVLAEGADEVVLSGINLGRFRATDERGRAIDLGGLIDRACALGVRMLRLSSIEPPDLTDSVLGALARHADSACAHLHLPLQSGCTATLARMGRHYTAEEFAATVARIRAALPHVSLSTDVICGFPGETDAEFAETLALCREMRFSKMHVFRYSARPGTEAAAMPGQVPAPIARERSERLRALAAELREADARARIGTVELALVERVDADGTARGTTASYHDVVLPAGTHALRRPGLARVRLEGMAGTPLAPVLVGWVL